MEVGLTQTEFEEFNKISNLLNLDTQTRKLSTLYIIEYKQKTRIDITEKLSLIINCAILAASKSQILITIKGETVRGIGLSITQLIRGANGNLSHNTNSSNTLNIDEFLGCLKDFINTVKLDHEVLIELKSIIEKFAFSYTFYTKYNTLLKSLDFKENISDGEEYLKNVKNFGWLAFICAKSHLLQNRTELVETVYLLTATLAHLLVYLPNIMPIGYFEKPNRIIYDKTTKRKNEEAIQETICELLRINYNAEDVQFHQKSYNEYLAKLIDGDILRTFDNTGSSNKFDGMYDMQNLLINFRKLEQYYIKKLNHDDLDERFYIRDKKSNHTNSNTNSNNSNLNTNHPGRFTPFARQGAANKNINIQWNMAKNDHPQLQKKNYNSHRMLNYEASEHVTMKSNLNEIKFGSSSKSIPPSSPYTRLVQATPMTTALEMYNWLIEKTKIKRALSGLPTLMDKHCGMIGEKAKEMVINRAERLIEKVLINERGGDIMSTSVLQKKNKDKHIQIMSLYYKVMEELLQLEEKRSKNCAYILINESFNKSIIACCIETVFFVNNSSSITFVRLLELCDIQPFEFWNIISSFSKFDQQIPFPIKKHLYEIETKILTCLAWKKDSIVHNMIKELATVAEENNNMKLNEKYPRIPEINENQMRFEQGNDEIDANRILRQFNQASTKQQFMQSPNSFGDNKFQSDATPSDLKKSRSLEAQTSQELFFKRVLHHTALEVYQLCEQLRLPEKISENVWTVMKYILSSETKLLIDRNLTQIILCTVYGVCKVCNHQLKFQDIITKYLELPIFNKNEVQQIIYNVHVRENERGDLIKFYNTIYIAHMKALLFSVLNDKFLNDLKTNPSLLKKPLIPGLALALASPLRDSLPYYMQNSSIGHNNKKKSPLVRLGMTPLTSVLYAESPKPSENMHIPVNSRRMLNLDDLENHQNDAMGKKFRTTNAIMDKIIEQKAEDIPLDSSKKTNSKRILFTQPQTQSNTQGFGKVLNYEDASTTNSSTLSSNCNSFLGNNSRNGDLNNSNGQGGVLKENNSIPLLFNSTKGGKQLKFDDFSDIPNENNVKGFGMNGSKDTYYNSHIGYGNSTSNNGFSHGNGSITTNPKLFKTQNDSLTPEFKKQSIWPIQ